MQQRPVGGGVTCVLCVPAQVTLAGVLIIKHPALQTEHPIRKPCRDAQEEGVLGLLWFGMRCRGMYRCVARVGVRWGGAKTQAVPC